MDLSKLKIVCVLTLMELFCLESLGWRLNYQLICTQHNHICVLHFGPKAYGV